MSNTITRNAPKILTKRHIGASVFLLAAFGGLIFLVNGPLSGFFARSSSADEDLTALVNPLPVNVAQIEFVDSIMQSRTYTGTILARHRSDLGFELSGKIRSIDVEEGDLVTEGQVLAELDDETLVAQQNAILAQLAQSRSLMDELSAGPRSETIKAAQATVDAAQSRFENAKVGFERRQRLHGEGAVSDDEFDQAKFARQTAEANLDAAQQQLSELEAGTRKEQLAGQRSAVRQLEASAKEIEVAISKSKLVAPFAGTVTRRYFDPGSVAQASSPIIRLVEQQHLEAWIGLPVELAAEVEADSEHEILIGENSFKGKFTAKIQELDPTTRTQTVLFKMEPDASTKAVSGQLCEIQISSSVESPDCCWIPTSALAKGVRGLWSVMVVVRDDSGNDRVQKRDIDIIKTDTNRVLARGTVQAGEQVVLHGSAQETDRPIRNGDRIVINGVHRIGEGQLVVPSDE